MILHFMKCVQGMWIMLISLDPDLEMLARLRSQFIVPISMICCCCLKLQIKVMTFSSKLLANRLTTKIDEIIPSNQSAFIRKRCIQDNFVYVQKTIQKFHNTRQKAVFIKLDISKAFDSVNWAYLLDVL